MSMTAEQRRFWATGAAIEAACEQLPEGFQVIIELENGSGNIKLYTPDGNTLDDFNVSDSGLDAAIHDAIIVACCLATNQEKGHDE